MKQNLTNNSITQIFYKNNYKNVTRFIQYPLYMWSIILVNVATIYRTLCIHTM